MQLKDKKYAIEAQYYGIACFCGSRRTERIEGGLRLCHTCGREGKVRVRFDTDHYHVYLEPVR